MKGSWESLVIQKWSWQAAPGDSDKGHSFSQQTYTPILRLSSKFPMAVSQFSPAGHTHLFPCVFSGPV